VCVCVCVCLVSRELAVTHPALESKRDCPGHPIKRKAAQQTRTWDHDF